MPCRMPNSQDAARHPLRPDGSAEYRLATQSLRLEPTSLPHDRLAQHSIRVLRANELSELSAPSMRRERDCSYCSPK